MKILLIHQYYLGENDPGGSRFNQFVKYWTAKGHQVTIVAGTVNYATGQKEPKYKGKWVVRESPHNQVEVYRCYVSEGYNRSFLGRLWAYYSFTLSSLWTCLWYIGKQEVMIVTSPPLFVGITGIVTSWIKRIPMIFEVRDLWPESAIDTGVLKNPILIKAAYLVERWSYQRAKRINVLTPAFREALIQKKQINPDKIVMIPNGADLDIFQPGPKENEVRERYHLQDKFVITYLGAHGVANHLWSLLKVAEECRDYPEMIFMLVGDGMEKPALQQYIMEKGLNNVLFVPPQPKSRVALFCQASDVCTAVLKKVDTFKTVYPNKVFDYMSCARPVLIGIDGVARQLVEQSKAGFYVDPENPQKFKEKLIELYEDPALREQLGHNGYQFVREHFSRQALADTYEKELRQSAK